MVVLPLLGCGIGLYYLLMSAGFVLQGALCQYDLIYSSRTCPKDIISLCNPWTNITLNQSQPSHIISVLRLCFFQNSFCIFRARALQCYGCNVMEGNKYVDLGCSSPEVITCSHTHKGFKQRYCIRTESMALGIMLSSGCATSRHCHQQELPGVRIFCCDTDLCNNASPWSTGILHYLCVCASLLVICFQV